VSQKSGQVLSVSRSAVHEFSKQPAGSIRLLEGLGVDGDAHAGTTVRHRSRVARNPTQPNLRQVHLIETELLEDLATLHHVVRPGDLGENITTTGIDLLRLPTGTLLDIGEAQVRLTGLRNPCRQIDNFQAGLLKQVVRRDGNPGFRGGVMAVVTGSGSVRHGDEITAVLPQGPYVALTRV
jgi:MOSC domain-containing protein YiiM